MKEHDHDWVYGIHAYTDQNIAYVVRYCSYPDDVCGVRQEKVIHLDGFKKIGKIELRKNKY